MIRIAFFETNRGGLGQRPRWMGAAGGMDNVFIARPWRGLKDEDIHLKGYAGGRAARAGIGAWIAFDNTRRPRQALASRTPAAIRRGGVTGAPGGKAVDMTPRLANAGALPACPRPQRRRKAD